VKSHVLLIGAGGMFGAIARGILADRGEVSSTTRDGADGTIAFDVLQSDKYLTQLVGDTLQPGGVAVNATTVLAGDMNGDEGGERGIMVNAAFPHRLARATAYAGQRVIQISTDAVFPRNAGVVDELDVLGPDTAYGWSQASGELHAPHALTIRCSIIGPPPPRDLKRGLWGFVMSSPAGASIDGYHDHLWSGILTHQLAQVCAALVPDAAFSRVREKSAVHHLAPNAVITKFELLCALRDSLRPDLAVRQVATGQPLRRLLISRYKQLDAFTAPITDWRQAISQYAA
jgi:dTDP-4-dehydrorhamnose reductase